MITTISVESNRYCVQQSDYEPLITAEEIEQFMGMLLLMSIVKMPSFRMFWAAETRYSPIADVMPRNRFEEIKRYFHFNDNANHQPSGTREDPRMHRSQLYLKNLRRSSSSLRSMCVSTKLLTGRKYLSGKGAFGARIALYSHFSHAQSAKCLCVSIRNVIASSNIMDND